MKKFISILIYFLTVVLIVPAAAVAVMSFYVDGKISLLAWKNLLFNCFIFYPAFWNTLLYAFSISLFSLVLNILGAFGMKIVNNRFSKAVTGVYLFLMMLPLQVTLMPVYIQMRDMHILDTRGCIILPGIFTTTGTVLMAQYMKNFNMDAVEAARLDTSSVVRILLSVVIPENISVTGTVFLLNFTEAYSLLEQPLLFLKNEKLKNLTVFISQSDKYSGNVMFPASVMYLIPVLLLYLHMLQIDITDVISRKREKCN